MHRSKLSRRDFLRLSVAATLGTIMAACKPAAAPPPVVEEKPKEEAKPEEKPAAPAEKATITFWSHSNPMWIKGNNTLIERFKEVSPNVTVKYENYEYSVLIDKMTTAYAAGTEPDMAQPFGQWVTDYAKGGRLAEVPDDVLSLPQAEDLFYGAPLHGFVWEGKLYGMPQEYNIENGATLVNKRMFEEAGLPYPPKWESWEELISDAQKLTKYDETGKMTVAGFHPNDSDCLPFNFYAGILQRGGDYFAKDKRSFNFNSDEAKETAQFFADLAQKHKVVDPEIFHSWEVNSPMDTFFSEMCAIAPKGPWVINIGRTDYPELEFDYVPLPYWGEHPYFAAESGWGLIVSLSSKHKDACFELMKHMCTDEKNHQLWSITTVTVPALKSVVEKGEILQDEPLLKASFDVLPYGRWIGYIGNRDILFGEIVFESLIAAEEGRLSVDEACKQIDEKADTMLAEYL